MSKLKLTKTVFIGTYKKIGDSHKRELSKIILKYLVTN